MSTLEFLTPSNIQEASYFLDLLNLQDNERKTRAKILSNWQSLDVGACPGSGKTSLLVANIGWAVDRWKLNGAGICVISHTNVAKDEITRRLTRSQASKLFAWPHFVGTIHEFANRFLAIPFLRSADIPVRLIDSDLTYARCLKALWSIDDYDKEFKKNFNQCNKFKLQSKLTNLDWYLDDKSQLKVISSGMNPIKFQKVLEKWSKESDCYSDENSVEFRKFLRKIKLKAFYEGFHSHADMLIFAEKALLNNAHNINVQDRFPLVFVDESQDTNEAQSKLLHKIFDPEQIVVQRFGDTDQQIFDFGEKTQTDCFMVRANDELFLSETHRCSQPISTVASQLSLSDTAITAVSNESQIPPQIILFNEDSVSDVIPKFLELINIYNVPINQDSIVKVIGQIGKNPTKKQEKFFPYSIWHYVPSFIKPNKRGARQPKTLGEVIFHCREHFRDSKDNYKALNTFFAAMCRLLPTWDIQQTTRYPFRRVKKALTNDRQTNSNGKKLFELLLEVFSDITQTQCSEEDIKSKIKDGFAKLNIIDYSKDFLQPDAIVPQIESFEIALCNSDKSLPVEINTIARVKGETHTATLILETYWHRHCIKSAIEASFATGRPSAIKQKQIKHLFVGMTRPEHMLCLALPKTGYEELIGNDLIKVWLDSCFAQPINLCN